MGKSNTEEKVAIYKVGPCDQVIAYDAKRDVCEIEDGLAVRVDDMLKTGIVRDGSANLDNNGFEEPTSIIGMVRDEFAAIDAMRLIRKYGKKTANESVQKAVGEAVATGAPAPTGEAPASS